MFGFILKTLRLFYRLGFKKTTIRVASRFLVSKTSEDLSLAGLAFLSGVLPACQICWQPEVPDSLIDHRLCRQELKEVEEEENTYFAKLDAIEALETATYEAEQAALEEYFIHDELNDLEEEPEDFDESDHNPDDEACPGDCGQTVGNCTCAELASWRAHGSNDGYWTA
jgi:hypothetical protein